MRAFFARLRRRARTLADLFPLTPLGAVVAGGCLVALLHFGLARLDLLLLVVGLVGIAVTILSLLLTVLSALGLWLSLRRASCAEPLRLECGYASRTGFSLSTLWYLPLVHVRWSWLEPMADLKLIRRDRRWHEEITPSRRGLYEGVVRRIEVGDAFGLGRIAFRSREPRPLRLSPSVGALKHMHVVRSIAGGEELSHPGGALEGERVDMRLYTPGDPIRFVLWKVFAKSRQLVVRTPERAIAPVRQTVAYLVAGPDDEPAAGAARVAVQSGALGAKWVLGADGQSDLAKSDSQAMDLLARSARAAPGEAGSGLASFLSRATPGGVLSRAVVFVPPRPGPWLARVVSAARQRSVPNQPVCPVEFVVCTDGVQRRAKRSRLARFFFGGSPSGALPGAAEVDTVVRTLSTARARVLVVDRLTGRLYTDGHRQGEG